MTETSALTKAIERWDNLLEERNRPLTTFNRKHEINYLLVKEMREALSAQPSALKALREIIAKRDEEWIGRNWTLKQIDDLKETAKAPTSNETLKEIEKKVEAEKKRVEKYLMEGSAELQWVLEIIREAQSAPTSNTKEQEK